MAYSEKEHLLDNIEAIKTVFRLDKEQRKANPQELNILRKYSGFGGIKSILFPHEKEDDYNLAVWKNDRTLFDSVRSLTEILKENITDDKTYRGIQTSLKSSVLSAFYTDRRIPQVMAEVLRDNGLKPESMLDPSAGMGVFGNTFKEIFPELNVSAREKDVLTAKLLKYAHPEQMVRGEAFEKIDSSFKNSKSLCITNIPFGDISVADLEYLSSADKVKRASTQYIHSYFFLKGMDTLKPGGILGYVTSAGMMNSQGHESVRQRLMTDGKLLGAYRMPENLFRESSGIEVLTDIILIQKRKTRVSLQELTAEEKAFIKTEFTPSNIAVNGYFNMHPENVMAEKITEEKNQFNKPVLRYRTSANIALLCDNLKAAMGSNVSQNIDTDVNVQAVKQHAKPAKKQKAEQEQGQLSLWPSWDEEQTQKEEVREIKTAGLESDDLKKWWMNGTLCMTNDGILGTLAARNSDTPYLNIVKVNPQEEQLLKDYIKVRESYYELTGYENLNLSENKELRQALNESYDDFTRKYGYLNESSNVSVLKTDILCNAVLALEMTQNRSFVKSDIFNKPVAFALDDLSKKSVSAVEALALCMNTKTYADKDFLIEKTGMQWDDIYNELRGSIFYDVNRGEFTYKDKMLSGNVVEKISEIEGYFGGNKPDDYSDDTIKALKEVVPQKINYEELDFNFGERWIPLKYFSEYLSQLMNSKLEVKYFAAKDLWALDRTGDWTPQLWDEYAIRFSRYDGMDVAKFALRDNYPEITKKVWVGEEKVTVVDTEKTRLLHSKIDKIRSGFITYMRELPQQEKNNIEELYNRKFNCYVKPHYDGKHLTFPGIDYKALGIDTLYPSQKDAIWMLLCNGGGIVDHPVGAGKTLIMCVAAMERKRLGLCHKPMIIATKSTMRTIARTFRTAYPNAKVIYSGMDRDLADEARKRGEKPQKSKSPALTDKQARERLYQNIANNDWDCVILTHKEFEMIPQDPLMQREMIEVQLAEMVQAKEFADNNEEPTRGFYKNLEKSTENLKNKLEILNAQINFHKQEGAIPNFNEMGIDSLYVDESHLYKNLAFYTSHTRVSGIGSPQGSQATTNLYTALQTIHKKNQSDTGVTFLSGTTISNSLSELFLIFKYLNGKMLKDMNMDSFDAWAAVFASKKIDMELGVTGNLKMKERFRYFIKIPELTQMYNRMTDYKTAQMIGLKRPEESRQLVNLEPSNGQLAAMDRIKDFANSGNEAHILKYIKSDYNDKSKMLIACSLLNKTSLDARFLDAEEFADDEGNKLPAMAKNIYDFYTKYDEQKGTQFVFSDIGVYKDANTWTPALELKKLLVEKYGIPSEEIVVNIKKTDIAKMQLADDMNKGKVRIAMGSTGVLGTGINAQERCCAIHHLDIPWRPSDLEQRNGRGIRPGNWLTRDYMDNKLPIFFYCTNRSLDGYKLNLVTLKARFIEQVKMGGGGVRRIDEGGMDENGSVSYQEYAAIVSGNQDLLEMAKLDKQINILEAEKATFYRERENSRRVRAGKLDLVEKDGKILKRISSDVSFYEKRMADVSYDSKDDKPYMTVIGNDSLKDKAQAGTALNTLAEQWEKEKHETYPAYREVGEFLGFKVVLKCEMVRKDELLSNSMAFPFVSIRLKGPSEISYIQGKGSYYKNPELTYQRMTEALSIRMQSVLQAYQKEYDSAKKMADAMASTVDRVWDKDEALKELTEKRLLLSKKIEDELNKEKMKEGKDAGNEDKNETQDIEDAQVIEDDEEIKDNEQDEKEQEDKSREIERKYGMEAHEFVYLDAKGYLDLSESDLINKLFKEEITRDELQKIMHVKDVRNKEIKMQNNGNLWKEPVEKNGTFLPRALYDIVEDKELSTTERADAFYSFFEKYGESLDSLIVMGLDNVGNITFVNDEIERFRIHLDAMDFYKGYIDMNTLRELIHASCGQSTSDEFIESQDDSLKYGKSTGIVRMPWEVNFIRRYAQLNAQKLAHMYDEKYLSQVIKKEAYVVKLRNFDWKITENPRNVAICCTPVSQITNSDDLKVLTEKFATLISNTEGEIMINARVFPAYSVSEELAKAVTMVNNVDVDFVEDTSGYLRGALEKYNKGNNPPLYLYFDSENKLRLNQQWTFFTGRWGCINNRSLELGDNISEVLIEDYLAAGRGNNEQKRKVFKAEMSLAIMDRENPIVERLENCKASDDNTLSLYLSKCSDSEQSWEIGKDDTKDRERIFSIPLVEIADKFLYAGNVGMTKRERIISDVAAFIDNKEKELKIGAYKQTEQQSVKSRMRY